MPGWPWEQNGMIFRAFGNSSPASLRNGEGPVWRAHVAVAIGLQVLEQKEINCRYLHRHDLLGLIGLLPCINP
jgi:hypothetical protein